MAVGAPKGRTGKAKGGRPKGSLGITAPVRDLARQHTAEAVKTLVALMKDTSNPAVRRAAAMDLLAYAYGRPREQVDMTATQLSEVVVRWQAREGEDYRREVTLRRLDPPKLPLPH